MGRTKHGNANADRNNNVKEEYQKISKELVEFTNPKANEKNKRQ